jgi:hypothetical protein
VLSTMNAADTTCNAFGKSSRTPGKIVVFDRSWYGRVLVERVEGLAGTREWHRGYEEINEFERSGSFRTKTSEIDQ